MMGYPKPHTPWALAALLALVTFALPMGTHAQEADPGPRLDSDIQKARADLAQVRKDIAKAEAEYRKTDSLLKDESARAAQSEDRSGKDRERRDKENQSLQSKLLEVQAKINTERSLQSRAANAADEIKARQKNLALTLAGYCDSVAARISSGLPWDREIRKERLLSLRKDLETGSASVDEGFARLNAMVKEEVKMGDEIAVYNKPITRKNGEVVNAQVLKLGNQWLVYMDEEGKHFGILERQPVSADAGGAAAKGEATWEWREDPGFNEKNLIRTAIEVKAAKRAPQLVVLDLEIAPGSAEVKKGGQ